MAKRSGRKSRRVGKKKPNKIKKYSRKRYYKGSKRSKRLMKGG